MLMLTVSIARSTTSLGLLRRRATVFATRAGVPDFASLGAEIVIVGYPATPRPPPGFYLLGADMGPASRRLPDTSDCAIESVSWTCYSACNPAQVSVCQLLLSMPSAK